MRRVAGALASLIVLLAARPAPALFHASLIDEVMSRVGSDATAQYVEIRMLASTQNLVTNTRLTAFNCNGTSHTVLLLVPGPNPPNSGANVRWIMATKNPIGGITPNFTFSPGIPTDCGMVCWGAPGVSAPDPSTWDPADPNQYVDCVAYGGYTGPRKTSTHDGTPPSGTPTTLPAGDGHQSLTRTTNTGNNLADFKLLCPTPTNNAGSTGNFGACTGLDMAGRVTTSGGAALAGATVTLSGAASRTTTTDSAGHYTFFGLVNGSYTVTASKSGCSFTPPSHSVTLSGNSVAGQNFTQSGGCC